MKNIYRYALASLLTLGLAGCDNLGDFGDTNVNPGATTEPVVGALMTNVQAGLGGYASMTRPGLYAQYFSQTQYTDESLYALPRLSFTGEYTGPLNDLQNIIDLNESNNMTQISKILQQYIYWTVTDRWGDVPYSQALKALETAAPAYDRQEDIYKGMISTLASAVASFDNTSAVTGDLIYGGNVANWKRAANSMRMLMAIRLSERFPGANEYAATEFKAALNDPAGYIATNDQNFDLDYPGGNFKNPWFNLYNGRKDYAESQPLVGLLTSLSDPRQNAFGGETEQITAPNANVTSNVGVPYGLTRANAEAFTGANANWARVLRGDFRAETSTQAIISAAQVALARAEAAHYGWTTENVQTTYNQGITLSFEQWKQPLPGNYLTQGNVAITGAVGNAADFRKIIIQRYIATYPDGLQGWSIWRKTGFPELTPAPAATNETKQIPRRYVYAATEATTNKANYEAAVANLQGGDTQDARVWWDKQ